jgi:thiol-disulfide isomerase/thioredoxin
MSTNEHAEQLIGSVLPDISLAPVSAPDSTWRLHEVAARSKGVTLVFWSSVCSHCERYDQFLNSFGARHPEKRQLGFTTLYDPGSAVARLLRTQHTPRAFLVDRESRLVYRGAIDNFKYPEDPEYQAYLEPAIENLLSGQPVARPDTPSFGCSIESVYYTIHRPFGTKPLTLKKP